MIIDLPTLMDEAERLSSLLDKGVQALRDAAVSVAKAEHEYRRAHAEAYLSTSGTVGERDAQAYLMIDDKRFQRDVAENAKLAALEALRSRRAQLSAVQSLLTAHKAEADFARTGPVYETRRG
jgi:hypothetical protein